MAELIRDLKPKYMKEHPKATREQLISYL